MATAEMGPFAKVGGLGDVLGALPKALFDKGVDVRAIMPLYGFIDRRKFHIRRIAGLSEQAIIVGDHEFNVQYFRSNIPESKVQVFFVECDELFDRDGVYADPASGMTYGDTTTRFILFSKAVVDFLKMGVFTPEILHLHDNQASLIAAMLRGPNAEPELAKIKILLTIHNLEYQNQCDLGYVNEAGLDPSLTHPGGPLEFYGRLNFLKAGIVYADKLSTVSETYAAETLRGPDAGFGLEGVLQSRGADYRGIMNGADYAAWDPANDKWLVKTYSARNLAGKPANKKALLEKSRLPTDDLGQPVVGVISRLVYQKGIDLIVASLEEIFSRDVLLVVLGTGDPAYSGALREAEAKYPTRLAVHLEYNEELAHLIVAGSDALLIPSRFEPCGLNQLYGLRYGTIPVARRTGGLADTIQDYAPETDQGWGFLFDSFDTDGLVGALDEALAVYNDSERWKALMKRAMGLDFSWNVSAEKYKQLYLELVNG